MDYLFTIVFIAAAVGIWYFIKKSPNKKNRNISIALLVVSSLLVYVFADDETKEEATAEYDTEETSTIESTQFSSEIQASKEKEAKKSEEAEESKEQEIQESKEAEESKEKEVEASREKETEESKQKDSKDKEQKQQEKDNEINEKINERLEENRGFAVGEDTSDGLPNPEFEYALAIDKVEYDVNLLRVYVNDNFLDYSKPQASEELKKVQNGAKSSIGEVEDWDTDEYQQGLPVYVYYGSTELGKTKMFDSTEFKRND
ncbi:hypothetical protein LQF67_01590 [Tetragenococcus halophilus]|uniref:hypothetical protein n=1 Tax=Tetragenococcus halophilus TaxID=51669 RepID=UPI001F42749A|nr:hypothetical protein [Tetragenococcus halophilus]MCF1684271.1 hypothetical protein [Tetragenococcus halophilus]